MFRNSLFMDGFDDPFFSSHRQQMERMNQMMAPFGGMLLDPFGATPAITNGREPQGRGPMQDIVVRHQDPFANPFGNMFGNMDRMMQDMMGNMNRMMSQASAGNNGQMFSHSSVMSYSNTGNGQPHVYQATSSTHQGPGGVKETRKTVRDSQTGVEKMAIGRHINDRGVVMTKSRNRRTNEEEDNQDYINLDEVEAEQFNREWESFAARGPRRGQRPHHRGVTDSQRSVEPPPYSRDPPPAYDDPPPYCPSPMEGASPKRDPAKLAVDGQKISEKSTKKKRVTLKSPAKQ